MNPEDKIALNPNLIPLNLEDEIPLNSNITHLNLEDGTLNSNNEAINLCVSCVFESWKSVDTIMKAYVLTTLNNSYNHMLFSNTEEYSTKYRYVFDDDVLKEIQFLTEHGNLYITTQ
ncbi:8047_t:CDS:2 [Funneliformis geosporum]|uniref:8047_t:CDS:1 n=1 Tax=Funneliformis geosporum TaxID=1117311 RepID=A0A9W4SGC8_9GLOM|nr:8047_t:CDS:2 [Funneliformis geosporum]